MRLSPGMEMTASQRTVQPLGGILIDASTSAKGWSAYGSFLKCPLFHSFRRNHTLDETAAPLVKGSIGHLLQAHQRAWMAQTQGIDVWIGTKKEDSYIFNDTVLDDGSLLLRKNDLLLSPASALLAWCERNPTGLIYQKLMLDVFDKWKLRVDPISHSSIPVAIETPITMELGIDNNGLRSMFVKPTPVALHMATIPLPSYEPILLDVPGHPEHGLPIQVTRRMDLITREGDSHVIVDHKHTSWINEEAAQDEYAIDGGFQLFDAIGTRLWGNHFKGTRLNLISTKDGSIATPYVRRTHDPISNMGRRIFDIAHQRASLELQTMVGIRKYDEWPDRVHEVGPCKNKYAKCICFEWCINGRKDVIIDDGQS